MGLLQNMSEMLGGLVTRHVDAKLFDWIRAVSGLLEGTNPAMAQLNWYIDPINGNDANDGASATTALRTDDERQRRMGENPIWSAGDYHIFYLNDIDKVVLRGRRIGSAAIFVHGSATPGNGQSILYSGTIDALTTLSPSTNQPWQITSNGLPVSWTASGLIDGRIRDTTAGTNLGAKGWAIKDLGGKQARCSYFLRANTYVTPLTIGLLTTKSPALNDTFVVERLTKINSLMVSVQGQQQNANPPFCVVFESLDIGNDRSIAFTSANDQVLFDGCNIYMSAAETSTAAAGGFLVFASCRITSGSSFAEFVNGATFGRVAGGYCTIKLLCLTSSTRWVIDHFIMQGTAAQIIFGMTGASGDDPGWLIGELAIFDVTTGRACVQVCDASALVTSTGIVWGSNNSLPAFFIYPGASLKYAGSVAANFVITNSSGSDFKFSNGRTSVRAFDDGGGTYTAARSMTFANLATNIAGGGFNGNIFDPVTGSGVFVVV